MKKVKEFYFSKARRITDEELAMARKAIEATLGIKRPSRGRPPKGLYKYRPIQIRLNPIVLKWAHVEAKHRGIGYQTFINEVLLHRAQAALHK